MGFAIYHLILLSRPFDLHAQNSLLLASIRNLIALFSLYRCLPDLETQSFIRLRNVIKDRQATGLGRRFDEHTPRLLVSNLLHHQMGC